VTPRDRHLTEGFRLPRHPTIFVGPKSLTVLLCAALAMKDFKSQRLIDGGLTIQAARHY
jgi:hypothetical protein